MQPSFYSSSTIDDRDVLFNAMAFHPHNANHCYIGCDEGAVLHTIRYGKRSIPSQYTSELGNTFLPHDGKIMRYIRTLSDGHHFTTPNHFCAKYKAIFLLTAILLHCSLSRLLLL